MYDIGYILNENNLFTENIKTKNYFFYRKEWIRSSVSSIRQTVVKINNTIKRDIKTIKKMLGRTQMRLKVRFFDFEYLYVHNSLH